MTVGIAGELEGDMARAKSNSQSEDRIGRLSRIVAVDDGSLGLIDSLALASIPIASARWPFVCREMAAVVGVSAGAFEVELLMAEEETEAELLFISLFWMMEKQLGARMRSLARER